MRRGPAAGLLLAALGWLGGCSPPRADLVVTGGQIWTGDAGDPWVQAVAIRGKRVVDAGDVTAIARYRADRVLDLEGRFAMPGFNDAHMHLLSGSLGLLEVDLNGARDLGEALDRVRAFALAHPDAEWITGRGWEYYIFPGGRLPRREDLDRVVPERPVFLRAYDGHTAWVNSKALAAAGIIGRSTFDGFGEIVTDPSTGAPTGALKEAAMALVEQKIPAPDRETRLEALRQGLAGLARLGVTSLHNAGGDEDELGLYAELARRGELTARIAFAFSAGADLEGGRIERYAALKREHSGPLLRVTGVKFVLDGVIESHTAAMLAPYANNWTSIGRLSFEPERFRDLVARADAAGLAVYVHAIGDRAVRVALGAFEHALRVNGPHDARFRIEHIETIHPADVARFGKLGVLAGMQPVHADPGTVEVWSEAIGPERLRWSFPWRMLEQAGATLVFGTDWPACYDHDPIRGLHIAVNRRTVEGEPPEGWLPEQRVTVETALRAFTRAGAWSSFEESMKGTLAPGMLADLIVLSGNPFEIDPMELDALRVEATVFDGKAIFDGKAR